MGASIKVVLERRTAPGAILQIGMRGVPRLGGGTCPTAHDAPNDGTNNAEYDQLDHSNSNHVRLLLEKPENE